MYQYCLMILFLLITFSHAEEKADATQKENSVINFIQKNTDLKEPWRLRNPFKVNLRKPKPKKKNRVTNQLGSKELIKEMTVDAIKVIGVLAGKEKRAFARYKGSIVTLKEGDRIGPDSIELKAILPGGIVIVDKFVNVYGQEEYLETIIPIGGEVEASAVAK